MTGAIDEDHVWRASLWTLEALPPTKRHGGDDASPLRRQKLARSIDAVGLAGGAAGRSVQDEVVPGATFMFGLLWWAERRGVGTAATNYLHVVRDSAGDRLVRAFGSPRAAHAALAAFARARVADRDTAFTEREIREQVVRRLLGR